jgi:hypothetical protein
MNPDTLKPTESENKNRMQVTTNSETSRVRQQVLDLLDQSVSEFEGVYQHLAE